MAIFVKDMIMVSKYAVATLTKNKELSNAFKKEGDFMKIEMYIIEEKNIRKQIENMSDYDRERNGVDTIEQFYVLQYLKSNLNLDSFEVYLINRNTIMVIDKNQERGFFKYDRTTEKILFTSGGES